MSALVVEALRLAAVLSAAGDALARPAGQTSARWQVLAVLEHGPATVADVARTLGLARQSVQRVADVVAEEGVAVYVDNPAHARAKLLQLTAHGRTVLSTIQIAQRAWADTLGTQLGTAGVSEVAVQHATVVLAATRRALEAEPLPTSP